MTGWKLSQVDRPADSSIFLVIISVLAVFAVADVIVVIRKRRIRKKHVGVGEY